MKKIYAFLLLFASFGYAQNHIIHNQLKLNNVQQGSASDSILVRGSNKIVKFVKKSDLLSGGTTADASATGRGSLQELGGADKLIKWYQDWPWSRKCSN